MKISDTYFVNCNYLIDGYKLIRGDEVTITNVSETEVQINNGYFMRPLWVNKADFEIHCVRFTSRS